MGSFEKLERTIALDFAPEIPVYPHIVIFAGRRAGLMGLLERTRERKVEP
jgi:hypothetical protein